MADRRTYARLAAGIGRVSEVHTYATAAMNAQARDDVELADPAMRDVSEETMEEIVEVLGAAGEVDPITLARDTVLYIKLHFPMVPLNEGTPPSVTWAFDTIWKHDELAKKICSELDGSIQRAAADKEAGRQLRETGRLYELMAAMKGSAGKGHRRYRRPRVGPKLVPKRNTTKPARVYGRAARRGVRGASKCKGGDDDSE